MFLIALVYGALFLNFISGAAARNGKTVDLTIEPEFPKLNDTVVLNCNYDFGNELEPRYILKIYKNDREFYRYSPVNNSSQRQLFPLQKLQIRVINDTAVEIPNVNSNAEGSYLCQVYTENFTMYFSNKNISLKVFDADSVEKKKFVSLTAYPERPVIGQDLIIGCQYNTGNDTLYALKIYKGYKEFFRYLPLNKPTTMIYHLNEVSINRINDSFVSLKNIGANVEDFYTCEMSMDAPTFLTMTVDRYVKIYNKNVSQTIVNEEYINLEVDPTYPSREEDIVLNCQYEIGNQKLHSLKLFKGEKEFYRYVPSKRRPTKVFNVPALTIIPINETSVKLSLADLKKNMGDLYSCHVTLEERPFRTLTFTKNITLFFKDRSNSDKIDLATNHFANLTVQPEEKRINESVYLNCNYDIGRSCLYSVRLYKDGKEFYSYMPGLQPPSRTLLNKYLEVVKFNGGFVETRPITINATGVYTCKVTGAEPNVAYSSQEQMITILQ